MSTFARLTKNPKTGFFEKAIWHDDYFAHHHYGVEFEDGSIVDPDQVELETKEWPETATLQEASPDFETTDKNTNTQEAVNPPPDSVPPEPAAPNQPIITVTSEVIAHIDAGKLAEFQVGGEEYVFCKKSHLSTVKEAGRSNEKKSSEATIQAIATALQAEGFELKISKLGMFTNISLIRTKRSFINKLFGR